MAICKYVLAILVAASIGGAADGPAGVVEENPLIAGHPVLADVRRLAVVLATQETPEIERLIDAAKLKTQISDKLREAGIEPVENDAEPAPRLIVHIEGIDVPGGDQYVYRVQTAVSRLVAVPGQGNRRLDVEVWRVRPVMAAIAKPQAGEAVSNAVLVQTGVLLSACEAARNLPDAAKGDGADQSQVEAGGQTPSSITAAAGYAFIASKSSGVFHRPDCRWAQNISGDNLVGYKTREEAIQSGKRPCKSCKP